MTDRESVIVMAKLASYDKYHASKDRKKAEYFRHDYVYRQNMTTRFFTLIGSLIVVLFYFLHRITISRLDIMDISEVMLEVIKAGIFLIAVQLLYSLLGFIIHSRNYNAAQERIAEYTHNMNELARLKSSEIRLELKERHYGHYEPDDNEYF